MNTKPVVVDLAGVYVIFYYMNTKACNTINTKPVWGSAMDAPAC